MDTTHPPNAWHSAVEAHLATLTQSQAEAFKVPASPEDCIRIIENSRRRRGITRILEKLKPVLEPLKRFESVIDVVVQTNGGIGSPIWGPLRLALMVACDHLETLEKLATILQRIVASLERYSNYEILFKNNLNTQKAIGALYSDLIDLCIRIIRLHSRTSIGAVFVSFDKEFKQISENITHHSNEIDWAANAANIEEAKKARGSEEATRQGQIRANVQQWLSPANVQDDLYRHENDCMSGSCNWALQTTEVQSFLTSEENEILRIGGAPGSGKSTLTAFFIRHLMQTTTGDVLHFFCKGTDEKKQKLFQVLRTLVSQLLSKDESLYPWFETLYLQSGQKTAESFATLEQSFQLALRNTSRTLIFIVIDALDECQEGCLLASSLIKLVKTSKGIVKLILTSREDPELLNSFNQPYNELIISPVHVRRPVWDYVEKRISQCKQINGTELGYLVHTEVARTADGSWLFARLMMDEIQRLPSAASIQRQLQHIPNGLAQLYQQMFASMEKSLSPLQLRLSQQVFLWVDMVDFVEVGREALSRETLDIVFQAETSGEEVFDSIDLARQLCFPLIRLYESNAGGFDVGFIHHTAAQFIREYSRKGDSGIPTILRPQALKELYRGNTSVWYFESCEKSTSLLEFLRAHLHGVINKITGEYFEMAYGLWNALFLQTLPEFLDEDGIDQASRLCDKMTEFLLSGGCFRWIEMAIIINYDGGFAKLFQNVIRTVKAAEKGIANPLLAFRSYSIARKQFFTDYAYVLQLTGPTDGTEELTMPDGFWVRSSARRLLSLGRRWAYLHNRDWVWLPVPPVHYDSKEY